MIRHEVLLKIYINNFSNNFLNIIYIATNEIQYFHVRLHKI